MVASGQVRLIQRDRDNLAAWYEVPIVTSMRGPKVDYTV